MAVLLIERVTLPASRVLAVATILMILTVGTIFLPSSRNVAIQTRQHMTPVALSTGIDSAILWLAQAQAVNGSYGQYYEDEAAAAALAFSSVTLNSVYAN